MNQGKRKAELGKSELDTEGYVAARKRARLLLVPNHPERPQIVSDRPVPQQTRGGARKYDCYYPLQDMLPGDSFWVPSTTQCTAGAVSKFGKKTGWRFVTRGQAEDGTPNKEASNPKRGTRVWRVS